MSQLTLHMLNNKVLIQSLHLLYKSISHLLIVGMFEGYPMKGRPKKKKVRNWVTNLLKRGVDTRCTVVCEIIDVFMLSIIEQCVPHKLDTFTAGTMKCDAWESLAHYNNALLNLYMLALQWCYRQKV